MDIGMEVIRMVTTAPLGTSALLCVCYRASNKRRLTKSTS